MQKAVYLEWAKWGWKGSNDMNAVQKVMRVRKMDWDAAKLALRAEYEKTQLPAFGYITAATESTGDQYGPINYGGKGSIHRN